MIRSVATRAFRSFFRPQKVRLQVEWLTHTDERIMETLEGQPATAPPALADRLDRSDEYIADRCRQLALHGLLERIERSDATYETYRLTEFGQRYLDGDVTADELQWDDNE